MAIHLTYGKNNTPGFLRYKIFNTRQELEDYLKLDVQKNTKTNNVKVKKVIPNISSGNASGTDFL